MYLIFSLLKSSLYNYCGEVCSHSQALPAEEGESLGMRLCLFFITLVYNVSRARLQGEPLL